MRVAKKMMAAILGVMVAVAVLGLVAGPSADAGPLSFSTQAQAPGGGGNEAECPSGSIEDIYGQCRVPIADAVTCPKGALGVPAACYIVVDKIEQRVGPAVCPSDSVEDIYGECRKPVADVFTCPKGTLGVPGACYIFVDKVMPKVLKAA